MSEAFDIIILIGKKKFQSKRSKYDLSPTDFSKYLNISKRTLEYWMDGKTSPNQKQIESIKNTLLLNGDIDENWNILDSDDRQTYTELFSENAKLKTELEELKTKYAALKETVPEVQEKLIAIQTRLIELTDENAKKDIEIINLKAKLGK